MKEVRYGVVGIGHMGSTHAKNIYEGKIPNARLVAVCDIDPKRLEWATENFGNVVKQYSDFTDFVKDESIDAVLIATPHYLHPPMAIESLEHGHHTLVEKPAGVYSKQVKEMNAVADDHPELVFGLMFNQRTNPLYQKAHDLVQSGELGELKRMNWIITDWYRSQAYYDQGGWRATWEGEGGGVVVNQAPHQLDLWQWICGMPKTLTAKAYFGRNRNIEVENDVSVIAEYENGATAVFVSSTHDFPGSNRLEISGDGGQIIIENQTLTFRRLKQKESEFNRNNREAWGTPQFETEVYTEHNVWGVQHNEILINFTEAILEGKPLLAPGQEGIKEVTLANAIHLSAFLGKTVTVEPFDDELYYEELKKRIEASNN